MRRLLTTTALLGIGIACASHAIAQGPVREGLRRTGEIAAEGTQRVIEGTGQAARAVGEGTLNAAGAAARGVRQGVDAVTPGLPLQARADANLTPAEQRRDGDLLAITASGGTTRRRITGCITATAIGTSLLKIGSSHCRSKDSATRWAIAASILRCKAISRFHRINRSSLPIRFGPIVGDASTSAITDGPCTSIIQAPSCNRLIIT
jgi:hypothetical protein